MSITLSKKTRNLQLSTNRPLLISTGISTMTLIVTDYSFLPTGIRYIKATALTFNAYNTHPAGIYYSIDGTTWTLYSEVFNSTIVNEYINTQIEQTLEANQGLLDTLNELKAALDDDQSAIDSIVNTLATKVDKISGKGLSTNDYTDAEKNKLSGLSNFDATTINTNISNLQNNKVDKVAGKGLSTNDYDDTAKNKVDNLGTLSSKNSIDYNTDIDNLPTIPNELSDLSEDATHRTVTDTEKNIWNNKSNFSGSYNDLTDKPTIPDPVDITGKADKVNGATSGNFAALDENGNLIDSGKNNSNFLTPSDLNNEILGEFTNSDLNIDGDLVLTFASSFNDFTISLRDNNGLKKPVFDSQQTGASEITIFTGGFAPITDTWKYIIKLF